MGYGSLSASAKSLALRKWLENWHWPGLPVPILKPFPQSQTLGTSTQRTITKYGMKNWQWPRLQVTATYYSSDSDTNIQNVATAPVSSSIIVALVLH